RWSKSKEEIRLFGVNYTLPFAHGFRAINYVNKDHKNAIDKDVYHLSRLDVNAFRVHIWDAEVTDSLGNLINSPQLDLLDYTLAKMKERGFKTLITPFKVGDNGYPEKNVPTQGFSNKLEKWQTYADEKIIEKQIRYFTQLLNHVNPYTGIAYKNDPDIIALEINNEPTHDNGPIATKYINRMVEVIRKVGFKNPIFYNISEVSKFVDNYLDATIQGCTFQWYPTGLVRNRLLEMNNLPNVDAYQIPFKDKKKFQNKARIIYEFDPGDTNQATLFPAMARSFREAKFQFAAQFAYDPIDLAFANTEYQTHYFNLAYTPSKAISFKIAAAVFRETPNGKSFGRYPNNNTFGNTTLNPDKNLAIYNSETAFFYTNSTEVIPKNIKNLKNIAGIGASNLVTYSGTGAYFLDKIENGIWRLEILPDVVWVNDPFAKASLK
ncbi:MAG: cellulase family glycosylhydrolase, partial [Flavobacteriia bacterium]|nr:cellulase family glycosylhydrolase [Flavobacteriia bacterium]